MLDFKIFKLKIATKFISPQFLVFSLVLLFFSISPQLSAQTEAKTTNNITEETKENIEVPQLFEIIPKAAELSDRLLIIENNIDGLVDNSDIEENYVTVAKYLNNFTNRLNEIEKSEHISFNELDKLKRELKEESKSYGNIEEPLTDAIKQLEKFRLQWLKDKITWNTWQSVILKNNVPIQVKQTFIEANYTINKALKLIVNKLNVLLKLQENGYKNQSSINLLNSRIDTLLQNNRTNAFVDASAPFFSAKFFEQFDGELWNKTKKGIASVSFPPKSFYLDFWWAIFLQLLITGFIIYLIRKYKYWLLEKEKYKFIANRSISSGIFFGSTSAFIINIYATVSQVWYYALAVIGAYSFCVLISNKNVLIWRKHFLYTIITILTITGLFNIINFPVPLYRIFIVSVSSLGLFMLLRWAKKAKIRGEFKNSAWFFYPITVYIFIIFISEMLGKEVLALYMYESLLKTIIIFVFTYIFLVMVHAGIEGLFKIITKNNNNVSFDIIDNTVNRVSRVINFIIVVFYLIPRILVIWKIYESIPDATSDFMSVGFSLGSVKITLGVIIGSLGILYGSYILSTLIEILIMDDSIDNGKLDRGTKLSISQLIRYFLLFVGFLIAVSALGFDLTNFTIVLSALGVGIGFGLQGVVNNFVSGLILLFERPIREGDTIEVEGEWSNIKSIGLRSTRVMTYDQADLIIPNSDLVYNKVTNWTLSHRRKRIIIQVGVAYGSDVAKVIKTLTTIAKNNESLVKNHKPIVLFKDFGASTLDFELLVWTRDASNALIVESELRQEIDNKFREENIEIAYPQQDLHIKSVDDSITLVDSKEVKPKTVQKKPSKINIEEENLAKNPKNDKKE